MTYLPASIVSTLLLCALLTTCALSASRSLYDVLEVEAHASEEDIRRAHKRLAVKWHPDKNAAPEAEETFIQVQHAYDILGDAKQRRRYDLFGADGMDGPEDSFNDEEGGGISRKDTWQRGAASVYRPPGEQRSRSRPTQRR
eukprot:jgi/Mesen1/6849/ME000351S05964